MIRTTIFDVLAFTQATVKRMDKAKHFTPRHHAYWKAYKRRLDREVRSSSYASPCLLCLMGRMLDVLDTHYT